MYLNLNKRNIKLNKHIGTTSIIGYNRHYFKISFKANYFLEYPEIYFKSKQAILMEAI